MLVKDAMRRPFVVDKDISLAEAARIMSSKDIGSLLFLSGNKVKGIVTEGGLLRNFGKHEKISQIMETNVITIKADENLDKAVDIMKENKIKRLPVVDDGKLVGIITITDLIANIENLEENFFFE